MSSNFIPPVCRVASLCLMCCSLLHSYALCERMCCCGLYTLSLGCCSVLYSHYYVYFVCVRVYLNECSSNCIVCNNV